MNTNLPAEEKDVNHIENYNSMLLEVNPVERNFARHMWEFVISRVVKYVAVKTFFLVGYFCK